MAAKHAFDLEKLATLARIKLSQDERENLTADLTNILAYVEKMNMLTVENVEATSHVLNIENVFREDTVVDANSAAAVLQCLPENRKAGPFFKVPKIIAEQ